MLSLIAIPSDPDVFSSSQSSSSLKVDPVTVHADPLFGFNVEKPARPQGLPEPTATADMSVMSLSERAPAIHMACAVIYRLREGRPEFCLVAPPRSKRFEIPQVRLRPKEPIAKAALRAARSKANLDCKCYDRMPLDRFSAIHNDRSTSFIALLISVPGESKQFAGPRCRWCFAEEARARIRRKPMRRLIDLALRRVDSGPKPRPIA